MSIERSGLADELCSIFAGLGTLDHEEMEHWAAMWFHFVCAKDVLFEQVNKWVTQRRIAERQTAIKEDKVIERVI